MGYRIDTGAQQTPPETAMDDRQITAQEDELQRIRDQITEAQARGDSKRANRLFADEMRIIGRQRGNAPIVGSRGRTA